MRDNNARVLKKNCCSIDSERTHRAGYSLYFTVSSGNAPSKKLILALGIPRAHPNPYSKRQLDPFIRFRSARGCDQQKHRQTHIETTEHR